MAWKNDTNFLFILLTVKNGFLGTKKEILHPGVSRD